MSYDTASNIARGLSYFAEGLSDISRMDEGFRRTRRQEEDWEEKKRFEQNVNTNMATLSTPVSEGQQPLALVGNPSAQAEARRRIAIDQQSKNTLQQSKEQEDFKAKSNALIKWRLANKAASWDDAPATLYPGIQGQKAYATLIDQEARTEEGKLTIAQKRADAAMNAYKQFSATKGYINGALEHGDNQKAINGIMQLTKDLPMPYKLDDYDPDSGTFAVKYLDSPSGEFQETGRISIQEALQKVQATGEKEFVTQAAMNYEAVRRGNVEKRQKPMHGRRTDGRRFLIIPQKNVLNPNQVQIEVRDEKTNELTMFNSWADLQAAGIHTENLEREGALKGLALADERMKSEKALQGKRSAEAGAASGAKLQKQYKEIITEGAKYFGTPGDSLLGPDGELSQAGENVRIAALKYYDQNKANAESLTGAERRKFYVARAVAAATDQMFQAPAPTPVKGPKAGLLPKPRKAKDGHYYIQTEDGGWARVESEGEEPEGNDPDGNDPETPFAGRTGMDTPRNGAETPRAMTGGQGSANTNDTGMLGNYAKLQSKLQDQGNVGYPPIPDSVPEFRLFDSNAKSVRYDAEGFRDAVPALQKQYPNASMQELLKIYRNQRPQ